MNCFKFHMSGKVFISPSFYPQNSEYRILGSLLKFSFSILKMLFYCLLSCYFRWEIKLSSLSLFLWLWFWNLIMMHLDVTSFIFLVLGACWDSCICGFIIFSNLENFRLLFPQIFFLFLPTSPFRTPILHISGYLKLSLSLLIHFFPLFRSLFFWIVSVMFSSSPIFFYNEICY